MSLLCFLYSWRMSDSSMNVKRTVIYLRDIEGISFLRLQAGGCVALSFNLMNVSPTCA